MEFSVKNTIKRMEEFFDGSLVDPDRKFTVVYKFHDSGEQDGCYTIRVENQKLTVTEGEAENPDLKVLTTAEYYQMIVCGVIMSNQAYWNGTMRYIGATLLWDELNSYLKKPMDQGIITM